MSLDYTIPKSEIRSGRFMLEGDVWVRLEWTEFVPRGDGEGVCSVCNSLMYDGDNFCPECGRKVDK